MKIDLTQQLNFIVKLFTPDDYQPYVEIDDEPADEPAVEVAAPDAPEEECAPGATAAENPVEVAPAVESSAEEACKNNCADCVNCDALSELPAEEPPTGKVPADVPSVEAVPAEEPPSLLTVFLREQSELGNLKMPASEEGLCSTKRRSLVILARRDKIVDEIEWGIVSLLADAEGAQAARDTRSYDLWNGRYYDIVVAQLIFPDRKEQRKFYFDTSKSMFRK